MVDDIVINCKLAEYFLGYKVAGDEREGTFYYVDKDGKPSDPPDFVHCYEECLRLIYPQLQPNYEIELIWSAIESHSDGDIDYIIHPAGWSCTIFGQNSPLFDDIKATGKTASDAFCQAALKLASIHK